ncbi:hypothetical protein PMAYCL1PPCAC_25355, partial [Pristionchus mayeri]
RQNADGSLPLVTHFWANTPADIIYKFYYWEVIYEGAVPRVLEHGPYSYIGHERKDNLTWSEDGTEV